MDCLCNTIRLRLLDCSFLIATTFSLISPKINVLKNFSAKAEVTDHLLLESIAFTFSSISVNGSSINFNHARVRTAHINTWFPTFNLTFQMVPWQVQSTPTKPSVPSFRLDLVKYFYCKNTPVWNEYGQLGQFDIVGYESSAKVNVWPSNLWQSVFKTFNFPTINDDFNFTSNTSLAGWVFWVVIGIIVWTGSAFHIRLLLNNQWRFIFW